ncbi:hypothetical protein TNCV_4811491 [Trichonephila clavipes]|nr:hypothetical protein TNCV_4811491 [Trichonephila clavipes]
MLEKVIENWTSRLDYIRASRGSPMPEIIFKIVDNLEREPVLRSWGPRKATVAHFRLLTGLDCPRSHLHRISIADSPDCTM